MSVDGLASTIGNAAFSGSVESAKRIESAGASNARDALSDPASSLRENVPSAGGARTDPMEARSVLRLSFFSTRVLFASRSSVRRVNTGLSPRVRGGRENVPPSRVTRMRRERSTWRRNLLIAPLAARCQSPGWFLRQNRNRLYSSCVPIQNQTITSPSRNPIDLRWSPTRTTHTPFRRSSNLSDGWVGLLFQRAYFSRASFWAPNGRASKHFQNFRCVLPVTADLRHAPHEGHCEPHQARHEAFRLRKSRYQSAHPMPYCLRLE